MFSQPGGSHWLPDRRLIREYQELYKCISFDTEGAMILDSSETSNHIVRDFIDSVAPELLNSNSDTMMKFIEFYTQATAVTHGIRVFRPTVDQCESFSRTRLTVPMSKYEQPFPVLYMELPVEFLKSRGINEDAGRCSVFHFKRPSFNNVRYVNFGFRVQGIYDLNAKDQELEAWIDEHEVDEQHRDIYGNFRLLERICFNSCLLLADRHVEKHGKHHEKNLKLAKRKDAKGERARRLLAQEVVEVCLDPEIKVWRNAKDYEKAESTPTGKKHPGRVRGGHWKMQAYGPHWSLHRRIYVPPYPINGGEPPGTTGTFRLMG